jgi:hypothetical protein
MSARHFLAGFMMMLAIALLSSCKKKESIAPVVESQIVISPEEIVLANEDSASIYLSVQPPAEYEWTISSKPSWLVVNPSSGTVNDKVVEIVVRADSALVSPGLHNGEIEIITNGAGKANINVQYVLEGEPLAEINPSSVLFTENDTIEIVTVKNIGYGILEWEFQNLPTWLAVNSSSGMLSPGQKREVQFKLKKHGLAAGSYIGQGVLVSNSQDGDLNIEVSAQISPYVVMTVSTDNIEMDYLEDTVSFYVKNYGSVPFSWNFSNFPSWLFSSNIYSGTIQEFDSVQLVLTANRANLASETYNSTITIQNDVGSMISIPAGVKNYVDNKYYLDFEVIDARYDKVHDRIVAVTVNPSSIVKIDPVSENIEALPLSFSPEILAIAQDGQSAVVGYNNLLTLVDLDNMSLEDEYAAPGNISNIAYGPYSWVYVILSNSSLYNLWQLNLQSGASNLYLGEQILAGSHTAIHPSGQFMYILHNYWGTLFPVKKFSLTSNGASFIHDSSNTGGNSISGKAWFEEQGEHFITREGKVLVSSTDESEDMSITVTLPFKNIIWLDHSSEADKYAFLDKGSSTITGFVKILDANLQLYDNIGISQFMVPDGEGGGVLDTPAGQYVFFNSSGTKIYVLAKNAKYNTFLTKWAIETLDVQ